MKWSIALISLLLFVSCQSNVLISNDLRIGEELMIEMRDGKRISASLLKAEGDRTPAVVIIVGSGNFSYRTYWEPKTFAIWKIIAESFVAKGYSVLLLEKRGINKSEGNWKKTDLLTRSNDVADAVRFLSTRGDIDSTKIGLCGHSQGGWVAQLAAANNPDLIDFIIALAGPAISVKEQVVQDHVSEWKCAQIPYEDLKKKEEAKRRSLSRLQSISGLIKFNHLGRIIDYSPEEAIARIQCPMIAVYAENDPLVVPEPNISMLRKHFPDKDRLTIVTIDSANHFFIPADFCTSWSQLKPGFAPQFKELLNQWLFLDKQSMNE